MITKRVIPTLPPQCEITGFLYESDDLMELSEDMLEVELSNGILITAGWHQGTPKGAYWVSVYRGCDDLVPAVHSLTARDAANDVERFVNEFCYRNLSTAPDSGSTIISNATC